MSNAIHFPTDWRFFVRNRRSKNAIMSSSHPDGRTNYVKFDQNDRPQLPLTPKPFLQPGAGVPAGTAAVAIYLHSSTRDFAVECDNAAPQVPGKVQKLCDIPLEHLDSPYLDDDKPPSSAAPPLHIRIRFESCTSSRVTLLQLQAIPIDVDGAATSDDRILSAPITYINRSMRKSSQNQGWRNVLQLLTSEVPDVWGKAENDNSHLWSAPGEGRPTVRRSNSGSSSNLTTIGSAGSSSTGSLQKTSPSPAPSAHSTPSGVFKPRHPTNPIKGVRSGGISKHPNQPNPAAALAYSAMPSPSLGLSDHMLNKLNLEQVAPLPLAFDPHTLAPITDLPTPVVQQVRQPQATHVQSGRAPAMVPPPMPHPVPSASNFLFPPTGPMAHTPLPHESVFQTPLIQPSEPVQMYYTGTENHHHNHQAPSAVLTQHTPLINPMNGHNNHHHQIHHHEQLEQQTAQPDADSLLNDLLQFGAGDSTDDFWKFLNDTGPGDAGAGGGAMFLS